MNLQKVGIVVLFQIIRIFAHDHRAKRFLIVPATAPTRHQLIWGIGVPLGSQPESVTTGWVIKAQYFMPTSIADLKGTMFPEWFERKKRGVDDENNMTTIYRGHINGSNVEKYIGNVTVIETKPLPEVEDEDPDEMEINYDTDIIYRGQYQNDDESVSCEDDSEEDQIKSRNSRWMIYKMIEGIAEDKGLGGRACLLRTICEAADAKFSHKNGLLGELLHIVLSPSTTKETPHRYSDNEFFAAEEMGKDINTCEKLFPECEVSFLELFSRVADPQENFIKF